MNGWDAAMIALAPFLRGHQMQRTWLAVIGASVATFFVHDPLGFILIDVAAAVIVMAAPSSKPQKMIGAVFCLMIIFELAFMLTPRNNWDLFVNSLMALGWVQVAILAGWTGHDHFRRYLRWSDPGSGPPAGVQRRVR